MPAASWHGERHGAVPGDEPLRGLSRLRLQEGEAVFGVRYAVARTGRVRLGDPVESPD